MKQRRSEAASEKWGGGGLQRLADARSTVHASREGGKMDRSRRGNVGGSYRKTWRVM